MSSSPESDVISKELENLDLIYYTVNLMTDVFKAIVKYRRKIIAKYRQILPFVALWEPSLKEWFVYNFVFSKHIFFNLAYLKIYIFIPAKKNLFIDILHRYLNLTYALIQY